MKRIAAFFIAIIILVSANVFYADGSGKTLQQLQQESGQILGKSYIDKEDAQKLLSLLDEILRLDPRNIAVYDEKAMALGLLGRQKEIPALYDKSIKLMPENSRLYFNKAMYLMELKEYKAAIASYDKVLKLNDKAFLTASSYQIWRDKADAYYSLKLYKEAAACIDKFVAGGSYYYDSNYGIKKGIALLESKRYTEASKWLEELKRHTLLNETSNLAAAYYYSACAYAMQGNSGLALSNLSIAMKFDGSYKVKAAAEKYFKGLSKRKEFIDMISFDDRLLKRLNLGKDFYVVDHLAYDVSGDKVNEDIVLIGRQCARDNINIEQVSLVIINNKTGSFDKITPKYTEGIIFTNVKDYLFLNDLNGDGLKDIIIKLSDWDTRTLFCAYSYMDAKPIMVFGNEKISEGLAFTGRLLDDRHAELKCMEFEKSFLVDPSRAPKSIEKKDEPGTVGRFWDLKPVDIDGDKVYELQGYQGVSGFGRMYAFGNVITTLKYDKSAAEWKVVSMEYK